MEKLYFPNLDGLLEGMNLTVRLGGEWYDLFERKSVNTAQLTQLGTEAVLGIADIYKVDRVRFCDISQELIDQAEYPGVDSVDDLYNMLAMFYDSQFDSECTVSLILFSVRE